jgi:alanine dehydrogenase
MIVGVPKEIKDDEYRVGMTAVGVEMLTEAGHRVLIEAGAGEASGIRDGLLRRYGAEIVDSAEPVWADAELVVKVKEPQPEEIARMREGQIVFTYFHLAASRQLTDGLLASGATCVAYETVQDRLGRLPLLEPMSEIAGKMAVQEAAKYLERPMGGRGVLLGGVPGTTPAHVMILGGGTVGTMAAGVAAGFGASVVVLDIDLYRLRKLSEIMPPNVTLLHSNPHTIRKHLAIADAVIGAVLVAGARAPRLVSREDLQSMKPGSVIVDVAVDQGGCIETTRPTTHHDPIYVVDDIVHYGVANMPGAVSHSSTFALTNATLPYVLAIAEHGLDAALDADPGLLTGVNVRDGKLLCEAVAEAFGILCPNPR